MYPYFDLITVISPEIAQRYSNEFNIDQNMFMLVLNPIPIDFLQKSHKKQKWSNKINRVAVVSNHKVPELVQMAQYATWKTDFFGKEYENSVAITPELLLKYDVIITIGKTVQYGLGLGIVVFEYDHNGGCGWITLQNMDNEAMTNFSGRSTNTKMDAKTIIKNIEDGYISTISQANTLREKANEKFSIIKLISEQLKTVLSMPPREKQLVSPDAWFYCNTCYMALVHIIGLQKLCEKKGENRKEPII